MLDFFIFLAGGVITSDLFYGLSKVFADEMAVHWTPEKRLSTYDGLCFTLKLVLSHRDTSGDLWALWKVSVDPWASGREG